MRIKLDDNTYLCAEPTAEPYKEIAVYIEKNGQVWQDLAIVGEKYHYEGGSVVNENGNYTVHVYADANSEDYTNTFSIEEYKE